MPFKHGLIFGTISAVSVLVFGALLAAAQGGNAGSVHGTVTDPAAR